MKVFSATDTNPALASALGRFAQASAHLEHSIQDAIIRILPLTSEMGLAILYESSIGRDLQILSLLLQLPETSVADEWREKLLQRIPLVQDSIEVRNRLLHNPIMVGDRSLVVQMHRRGKRSALEIDVATILTWAQEASEHAFWFGTVPHGDYDFSTWGRGFADYQNTDWPARRNRSSRKFRTPMKTEE
ncbi:hypothetical protein [Pararhizobium qamdonense]|uniref:hypothetical protein n=1 Tax=Pararhizobium qamdonense TaxID=3031126 RepID=UPI0023E30249|nr:hypothetical protein [Pararhizobium qamdonense]